MFNLDINSIDVYVRSTNDNDEFNTDFSMYKNNHESKEKKITVPIKMRIINLILFYILESIGAINHIILMKK